MTSCLPLMEIEVSNRSEHGVCRNLRVQSQLVPVWGGLTMTSAATPSHATASHMPTTPTKSSASASHMHASAAPAKTSATHAHAASASTTAKTTHMHTSAAPASHAHASAHGSAAEVGPRHGTSTAPLEASHSRSSLRESSPTTFELAHGSTTAKAPLESRGSLRDSPAHTTNTASINRATSTWPAQPWIDVLDSARHGIGVDPSVGSLREALESSSAQGVRIRQVISIRPKDLMVQRVCAIQISAQLIHGRPIRARTKVARGGLVQPAELLSGRTILQPEIASWVVQIARTQIL